SGRARPRSTVAGASGRLGAAPRRWGSGRRIVVVMTETGRRPDAEPAGGFERADPVERTEGATLREQRKADRRVRLLDAAAHLFADRGYDGVSMRDLGSAADVSGPAVYRHFASKQDVLVELLVGISERLLSDGERQIEGAGGPQEALERLAAAHARFAVADRDLIRIQDRSLSVLGADARHRVRRLQREYVELWVSV